MSKTKINWADKVWNPVTGCTKISEGCKHCYAEGLAKRFWGGRKFSQVQCHVDRLLQPLHWKKPSKIFVNSMSDLFHEDVDDGFLCIVFDTMMVAEQHTFLILTKRPERMKDFITRCVHGSPKNIWLGVSVENQQTADERIPILLETPAAVRFVSCEPLLGPINLRITPGRSCTCLGTCKGRKGLGPDWRCALDEGKKLDWVIVGGESGPKARPMKYEWAFCLCEQSHDAGVPFFYKQGPDDSGKVCQMPKLQDIIWDQFPKEQ